MPLGEGKEFGGDLHVRLSVADGRVRAVRVRSTRPADAARVFMHRTPADAVTMMGMLFSLCGRAQTIAGLRAIERAGGLSVPASAEAAREILRLSEMLSQTAMRVGLDWPRLAGVEPRADVARACLSAERDFERALFGGMPWKTPGGTAFAPSVSAVRAKAGELAELIHEAVTLTLAPALRGVLAEGGLDGFGAGADDMEAGLEDGLEDGALKRNWNAPKVAQAREAHGAGLLARLEARLAELDALPKAILDASKDLAPVGAVPDAALSDGQGAACVETARGPLTHTVAVQAGRIASYRIDAPTDANFAPGGVVASGLTGAAAKDLAALKRAAELHVMAVDPCVSCAVEIEEA